MLYYRSQARVVVSCVAAMVMYSDGATQIPPPTPPRRPFIDLRAAPPPPAEVSRADGLSRNSILERFTLSPPPPQHDREPPVFRTDKTVTRQKHFRQNGKYIYIKDGIKHTRNDVPM